MKSLYISAIFLLALSAIGCKSKQESVSRIKSNRDTTRVLIYGEIYDSRTKERIPNVSYVLNGTKLGGHSDNSGKYFIDVSKICDTTKTYHLKSKFINMQLSEIYIEGKIKKSIKVDFIMIDGEGNNQTRYKVNEKNELKEIGKTINGG